MEILLGIGSIIATIGGGFWIYWLQRRDRLRERESQQEPRTITLQELDVHGAQAISDRVEQMVFHRDAKYRVFKGYLPHWHQGYGGYEEGVEFVWLEYECKLSKPAIVQVQVEGPRDDSDVDWSSEKEALYKKILKVTGDVSSHLPFEHWPGRNASIPSVRRYSSTTVFAIDTGRAIEKSAEDTARRVIEDVHARIGGIIESAWRAWWEDSGRAFIKSQES